MKNLILMTDGYKVSQWAQYPMATSNIYSYCESRGGEYDEVTFFGLQYILKKYLCKPISHEDIKEARDFYASYFGDDDVFEQSGWNHILKNGGYLPLRIKAVPEGTTIPTHNVLMTIENTNPRCAWLTNYMETLLSLIWYPTTVATVSREAKKTILSGLQRSGTPELIDFKLYNFAPELIDFKLHDFGFRGASSVESAAIGGCAHLVNFKGTDTIPAVLLAKKYYGCDAAGFSVPATEHSTITSWGRENEEAAYKNMVDMYGDMPVYACVTDSYNFNAACMDIWGDKLKQLVMAQHGKLIVRHDSGDPIQGTIEAMQILSYKFGYTVNSKGFRVLNPKVGFLWGDGLDNRKIGDIIDALILGGWSVDNIGFGMGGGLLQKVNRDTQKFAIKCSSAVVEGEQRDVYKSPVSDKSKGSKRGRFDDNTQLETVFENGELLINQNLNNIRERAMEGLNGYFK